MSASSALLWLALFAGLPAVVAVRDSALLKVEQARLPDKVVIANRPPPPVEPVELQAIAPETAREINAAIPFVGGPKPAARPFVFQGDAEARARATACLAAAQYYEAGDDTEGQKAVAQVVLNRVRHPAFPKTVCGVVFQGQDRTTGCQFTFTCDGALARSPSATGWRRAMEVARMMLAGQVYRPVGLATHYHTDWVVPYWSNTLDKVAAVKTHLFFRWKGYWGTRAAFDRHASGQEPNVGRIAALDPSHHAEVGSAFASRTNGAVDPGAIAATVGASPTALASAPVLVGAPGQAPIGRLFRVPTGVRLLATSTNEAAYIIEIPSHASTDRYAEMARTFCSGQARCRVMGWRSGTPAPTGFPVPAAALSTMTFSYIHDAASNLQRLLWNCEQSTPPAGVACMRSRVPVSRLASPQKALPGTDAASPTRRSLFSPAPTRQPLPTDGSDPFNAAVTAGQTARQAAP